MVYNDDPDAFVALRDGNRICWRHLIKLNRLISSLLADWMKGSPRLAERSFCAKVSLVDKAFRKLYEGISFDNSKII